MARAATAACGLDAVVFVPCRESPLKGRLPGADGRHRAAMLRELTGSEPWALVSEWELERPGPSYSWETVQHFRAAWPEAELHWIMGADQWAALERWARPEVLRNELTFVVFARDGEQSRPRDGWRLRVVHGEWPVSSTAVREALGTGRGTDGLLAPETAAYVRRHGLYAPPAAAMRSSSMAPPANAGSE